jgi:hypothetical protein
MGRTMVVGSPDRPISLTLPAREGGERKTSIHDVSCSTARIVIEHMVANERLSESEAAERVSRVCEVDRAHMKDYPGMDIGACPLATWGAIEEVKNEEVGNAT